MLLADSYSSDAEEVIQKFTVIDAKTKKPVASAPFIVNGTPRFTNTDGTVRIREKKYKDVLVRVETSEYLPYISYYTVEGDDKVIELKKPNHDIEIFASVLEYEGQFFNLTEEPCYINLGMTDSYSEIVVESNVDCEEYWLYANGEPCLYSHNGIFDDIVWTKFNKGDKLSVTGVYQDVESEPVDLNIFIEDYNEDDAVIDGPNFDTGIDEDDDFGLFGNFNINYTQALFSIFNEHSFSIKGLNLSYFYDARKGTFSYTIGYSFTIAEKHIDLLEGYKKELENNKEEVDELREESDQLQKDMNDLKKSSKGLKDKKKQRNKIVNHYERKQNSRGYKNSKNAQRDFSRIISGAKTDYQNALDKVAQLAEKVKNGGDLNEMKRKISQLSDRIKKQDKVLDVIDSAYIDFKLEFEIYGKKVVSIRTGKIVDLVVGGGLVGTLTISARIMISVVPVLFRVTITGKVNLEMYIVKKGKTYSLKEFLGSIVLNIAISARVEAGINADLVIGEVGVTGFGELSLLLNELSVFDNSSANGALSFKLGLKFYLLLWDQEIVKQFEDTTLFDNRVTAEQMIERQEGLAMSGIGECNIFADKLYAPAIPKWGKVGDKLILTWIEDDLTRDSYNRTRLMYSVFDGESWSEPSPVADDGNADFYQDVYSDGKDMYVTWQKIGKRMSENDGLADYVKMSEVVLAKFDPTTNAFDTPIYLTQDEKSDMNPKFALKENDADPLTVVWRSNSANDLLGLTGVNTVYSASENMGWNNSNIILQEEGTVGRISSAYIDGKLSVEYTIDKDGDFFTVDNIVKIVRDGKVEELENQNMSTVKYSKINGQIVLTYYNYQGYLNALDGDGNAIDVIKNNALQNGAYDLVENQNGKVIFYSKLNGDYKQAYCALYNEKRGEWITDILLTEEKNNVIEVTGWVKSNGNIHVVYTLQDEKGNTALCMKEKQFLTNFQIVNAYIMTNFDGKEVLDLAILNTGDTNIEALRINALGKSVNIDLEESIRIGELRFVTVDLDFGSAIDADIVVDGMIDGQKKASATYHLILRQTDLGVSGDLRIKDGRQVLRITVNNMTDILTDNAKLSVYLNGEVIQQHDLTFTDGMSVLEITFDNIKNGDYIYVDVECNKEEVTLSNNHYSTFSIIDEIKETQVDISGIQAIMNNAKKLVR